MRPQARSLVLHADDYGMNPAVTAGILQSLRMGVLTSTSMLVNAPGSAAACPLWKELACEQAEHRLPSAERRAGLGDDLASFDLGIHLNLTQGRPLTSGYPAALLTADGHFPGIGAAFRHLRRPIPSVQQAVHGELQAQIEWMIDAGLPPTHLNGHQYIELIPGVASLIPDLMRQYRIPVVRVAREAGLVRTVLGQGRLAGFGVALIKRYYADRFQRQMVRAAGVFPSRFFGTSHAGVVTHDVLELFLDRAGTEGCTEVGLHPALPTEASPANDPWFDPLATQRPQELQWLCDPQIGDRIARRGLRLGRLQNLVPS